MISPHLRVPTKSKINLSTGLTPFSNNQQRDTDAAFVESSPGVPSMKAFGKRRALSPRPREDNGTASVFSSRTDSPWKKALRREAQGTFMTDQCRLVMTWREQIELEKDAARSLYLMKLEDTLMSNLRCRDAWTDDGGSEDRESSVDISDRRARDATEAACTDAEDDVVSGRSGAAAYNDAHYTLRTDSDSSAEDMIVTIAGEVGRQDEARHAILASRVGGIITPPPTPKTTQKRKVSPNKEHDGLATKRQRLRLNCPSRTQASCPKGRGDVAAVGPKIVVSEAQSKAPVQTRSKRISRMPKRLEDL